MLASIKPMSSRQFDEAVVLVPELPAIDLEKLRASSARVRARLALLRSEAQVHDDTPAASAKAR